MLAFAMALLLVNAGFVDGLWYSRFPFFAGETVRLYAALQNNSGFDIKGKAVFFDKNEKIGEANFSVVNGRLLEVWTDWQATKGNHAISVTLTEAFKMEVGKNPAPVTLAFASFAQKPLEVDKDTDGDGIGDKDDTDDDNDSLSDSEEKKYGTDQLAADSDGDGVSDEKEISGGTDPLKPPSQKIKEEIKENTLGKTIEMRGNALKEVAKEYAPRAAQTIKTVSKAIDDRANRAAKTIRIKKDNLAPSQYQSLFSVSLALLLPLAEHWRIAAAIFAAFLLWLFLRRLRN